MIIILSPAKTLKRLPVPFEDKLKNFFKEPILFKKSQQLIAILKELSQKEVEKLLNVSSSIAKLNYERFRNFPQELKYDEAYPSIFLFYGDVYKGFQFNEYNEEKLLFLQEHVRILSGLYGILKPFDLIYAYRLEMGTDLSKIKKFSFNTLYEFWGNDITQYLKKELEKHKNPYLINLASKEYSSSIDFEQISFPVIHINFQEKRNGKYTTIALNSKRARGKMTNWIIQNKIDEVERLKEFNLDGYRFSLEKSDSSNWYFLKN